jgi:hypothetical protein
LHTLAGRSHYSTLAAALPLILEGGKEVATEHTGHCQ